MIACAAFFVAEKPSAPLDALATLAYYAVASLLMLLSALVINARPSCSSCLPGLCRPRLCR